MIRWRNMTDQERRYAEAGLWHYLPEDHGKRVTGRILQVWFGRWRDVWSIARVDEAA